MEFKKTIAIDFDGVLNEYKGYDRKNLYQPRKKVKEFLIELNKKYTVIVFTSRLRFDVERWLKKHHTLMTEALILMVIMIKCLEN